MFNELNFKNNQFRNNDGRKKILKEGIKACGPDLISNEMLKCIVFQYFYLSLATYSTLYCKQGSIHPFRGVVG